MKRALMLLLALAFALSARAEAPVDLDLTRLSGTVVYSQIYDMMEEPEIYVGQRIRLKGSFNYYRDEETGQEYFAALIADATACCAQGIEFVRAGEYSYPRDYPPPDTEITVTSVPGDTAFDFTLPVTEELPRPAGVQ